jgi:lipopolysaccharide export system protein LptA
MPQHHFPISRIPRFLAAIAGLMLMTGLAHAELADKDKPMNIEADSLRYDDATQTSVFTGKVVITKGTIIMRGNKMDVRQDAQGNQFGLLLGAPGFFRQKREGLDEWVEGEADRVDYDSQAQTVVLTGNAALRRYRGTALNDENLGNQITYNSLTEVFTVKGGAASSTPANPSGRVRAMLTPIPDAEKNAPAPANTSPAKLRPSTDLNEKRK